MMNPIPTPVKKSSRRTSEAPASPARPQHFDRQFTRLLIHSQAVNQVGADGVMLLLVVMLKQDAQRFSRPVDFWNGQLMDALGMRSVDTLKRVRARCIEAGWLQYQPGSRSRRPLYAVAVPGDLIHTNPTQEADSNWAPTGADLHHFDSEEGELGREPVQICTSSDSNGAPTGADLRHLAPSMCTTSLPFNPNPNPDKDTLLPSEGNEVGESARDDSNETANQTGPNPETVIAHWNSHPGLTRCTPGADPNIDRLIRSWATQKPRWIRSWRDVISFMGRQRFYCGGGQNGWRADIEHLFKKFDAIADKMEDEARRNDPAELLRRAEETARDAVERMNQQFQPIPNFNNLPPRDLKAEQREPTQEVEEAGMQKVAVRTRPSEHQIANAKYIYRQAVSQIAAGTPLSEHRRKQMAIVLDWLGFTEENLAADVESAKANTCPAEAKPGPFAGVTTVPQ